MARVWIVQEVCSVAQCVYKTKLVMSGLSPLSTGSSPLSATRQPGQ